MCRPKVTAQTLGVGVDSGTQRTSMALWSARTRCCGSGSLWDIPRVVMVAQLLDVAFPLLRELVDEIMPLCRPLLEVAEVVQLRRVVPHQGADVLGHEVDPWLQDGALPDGKEAEELRWCVSNETLKKAKSPTGK